MKNTPQASIWLCSAKVVFCSFPVDVQLLKKGGLTGSNKWGWLTDNTPLLG